jgi:hypothetical protein
MMDFVSKRTIELNEKELQDIASLFSSVFKDHASRSTEFLLNQYTQNAFGTSYHTMMYDGGVLVGHIAGMPGYYCLNGKRLMAVNPVDLMIEEKHRGLQGFMFLIKKAWGYYKEQGVQIIYNLPNNNSHPLFIKLKCVKNIGSLFTYVLPYRIGGAVNSLKLFNFLSIFFSKAWVTFSCWFASSRVVDYSVQRDYVSFLETRYKRSDGVYSFGVADGVKFVYKIMNYEGKRTAFLIDVYEKSQKAFCKAVQYIIKKESAHFDLILYVGYLPFINPGLIRVPHKYEPKNFNFDGIILKDEGLTEQDKQDYYNLSKWDINLCDDDVI